MNQSIILKKRIDSIDWIRGLVLVIMALDHSRFFFLKVPAMDIEHTTLPIFFTRWLSGFCAPTFVLLAGMSVRLVVNRNGLARTSRYLFTRGLLLVFLELTFVRFGFGYYSFKWVVLQVIFVIGVSMVLLAGVMYFKKIYILLISLVMIAGHNALDKLDVGQSSVWLQNTWMILHQGGTIEYMPGWSIAIWYPLIPWPAVMFLGYLLGGFYELEPKVRNRLFITIGTGCLILFVILRLVNSYGDPNSWQMGNSPATAVMSFMTTEKYPPSLQFLALTLSVPIVLLGLLDKTDLKNSRIAFFGKNSLLFYIVHLYILSAAARFFSGLIGREFSNIQLLKVYVIWMILIIIMYPFCLIYKNKVAKLVVFYYEKIRAART